MVAFYLTSGIFVENDLSVKIIVCYEEIGAWV
jgi:hypothetical protein